MSTVIRSGYPDLFDLSIAAQNYFVDAFEQYPMAFPQYFYVDTSTLKSEKVSELGGLTEPSEVGENNDFPEATPVEGYDTTFTHAKYAQTVPISYEAREDDPKGILTNLQAISKAHVKAMHTKACKLAANVLINGWATACPDGQYLIDTDHPTSPSNATTLSNKITSKLDSAGLAVQDMITKIMNNGKDMAGNQIMFGTWRLVVPPALYSNALKSCVALYGSPYAVSNVGVFSGVVGGGQQPTPIQTGEIFRTSTTTGQSIMVVQEPCIGSGYSGGSDVKWYMIADPQDAGKAHSLRFYWRAVPQIVNVSYDQENFALKVPGLMRCSAGAVGWRHVWGSDGTV